MKKSKTASHTSNHNAGKYPPHSPTELTQVLNVRTGNYIKRDFVTGEFVNIGDKPFEGLKVVKNFKSASNPSISRETAVLAEKAVIAVLNSAKRDS